MGGVKVRFLFCFAVICVPFSFAISLGRERAGCFILVEFWMSGRCYRSLTYPLGAKGWSVVMM